MKKTFKGNSFIEADHIEIGKNFKIGHDVRISVRKTCIIGDNCRFGNDVKINAENLTIGDHFFHLTPGLEIGGGGSQFEDANITIGDRCVMHNNYINLACPVSIGNDVGLSPDVKMITHGFWSSCLKGYPTVYKPIIIRDNVIIGQGTMILPGANIPNDVVIGAASVVTKSTKAITGSIVAGNPAKFIKLIIKPTDEEQREMADIIIQKYVDRYAPKDFAYKYPSVRINKLTIHLLHETCMGLEDDETIKFRDHLRRYGIRIYTDYGF